MGGIPAPARHWAWVVAQGVLLALLVLTDLGPDIDGLRRVEPVAWVVAAVGLALLAGSLAQMASALTPSPEPRPGATLRTGGLYRLVRHPMYAGVVLVATAAALLSTVAGDVVVAGVLYAFFALKARYEEGLLVQRYPQYRAYAARTPRFWPLPRPRRGAAE